VLEVRPSQDERAFDVEGGLRPVMLDPVLEPRAPIIKSQAVFLGIELGQKTELETGPLLRVYDALEHRILDTLTVVATSPRHSAKSPRTIGTVSRHVVADEDEHRLSPQKWRVVV